MQFCKVRFAQQEDTELIPAGQGRRQSHLALRKMQTTQGRSPLSPLLEPYGTLATSTITHVRNYIYICVAWWYGHQT